MKPEPHDFLVKGTAYRQQFLAGAGGFWFTLDDYVPASLNWVLQQDWKTLHIRPL